MRGRRRVAAALAAVLVGGALGAGAYAFRHHDAPARPRLTTAELSAYQAGVLPPLREGGQVVEQELKPAVADLAAGKVSGPAFAAQTTGWLGRLAEVRRQVAGVVPPPDLRPAADGFDRALARYADTVRAFGAAASASKAGREAALANAYEVALDADHLYDTASAVIQQWRRRLGLGTTPDFPNPSEGS
jgi:hypothetical protein